MYVAVRRGSQREFAFLFFVHNSASCTKNFSVAGLLGSASHQVVAAVLLHLVTAYLRNLLFLKSINTWWRRQGSGSFLTQDIGLNGGLWFTAASPVCPAILKHFGLCHTFSLLPSPLPSSLSLHPRCLAHDLMQHNSVWNSIACWKTKRQHFLQIRYLLSIWAREAVPNVLQTPDCWQRIFIYHAKAILFSHVLNNKNANWPLMVKVFLFYY